MNDHALAFGSVQVIKGMKWSNPLIKSPRCFRARATRWRQQWPKVPDAQTAVRQTQTYSLPPFAFLFWLHEVLRNAHQAPQPASAAHAHSHLAQTTQTTQALSHSTESLSRTTVASTSVVPAARPGRSTTHEERRQLDAELPSKAREDAAADERHDDEDKDLDRVAAEVVPQLAEQVLELGDEAGDEAVARPPLVVGGAAGAAVAVRVRPRAARVHARVGRPPAVRRRRRYPEPRRHGCGFFGDFLRIGGWLRNFYQLTVLCCAESADGGRRRGLGDATG